MTAAQIISLLNLSPLPGEGGYFYQSFKSKELGNSILGTRPACTAIFYLVTPDSFSKLHRVKQDEIFHFYLGSPVEMLQISPTGKLQRFILGPDLVNAQKLQLVVPKLTWQGTKLCKGGEWALMGCTIAPGFEFEDLEIKSCEELSQLYPTHATAIKQFT